MTLTRQEIMTFLTGMTELQRVIVNEHWAAIYAEIDARALQRPLPKAFEIHHEVELARMAFLETLMVSSVEHASEEARKRVSLIEPVEIVHSTFGGKGPHVVVHKTFTVKEAEGFLATSATIDPDDLEAGHYTIDYPEWMEEIVQRGATRQPTMEQIASFNAAGRAADRCITVLTEDSGILPPATGDLDAGVPNRHDHTKRGFDPK